jgi:2-iminobutanoate/2-iminopropanoate deaminase
VTIRTVRTDHAPDAIGAYAQGVIAQGLLFTAGQIPLDPSTNTLVPGGIAAQAERGMLNLTATLREAGATWADVAKTTVYLSDMTNYQTVDEIYTRHLGGARPARSTVAVGSLARGALLEIDVVVAVK